MRTEDVPAALAPLRDLLRPDGYDLAWEAAGEDAVALEVVPGEDACADCLVPRAVMHDIASRMLAESGLRVTEIRYPQE